MQVGYILPRKMTMDIRDSMSATWRNVIRAVLYSLGKVHYTKIVKSLRGHKKAECNNHLEEKVRPVLRAYPRSFTAYGNDIYECSHF